MYKNKWIKSALLVAGVVGLTTAPVVAKKAVKPPVTVKGFAYKFYPKPKMHMNDCTVERCGKGSKVSYILSRPKPSHSFSGFKAERKKIAVFYASRAPKGVTLTFGEPSQKKTKDFTIYIAPLHTNLKNGTTRFRSSYTVHGKKIWISLISSSSNKKLTKDNGALFLAGLMAWSKGLKK